MDYIKSYEYEGNVNPKMNSLPVYTKNIQECDYGISFIDFSNIYNVNYQATTPNLLASFIKLEANQSLIKYIDDASNILNASSHLFFIIKGECKFTLDNSQIYTIECGGIFVSPFLHKLQISNNKDEELQIYYINDSPLLNYLGSQASRKTFLPCVYTKEYLLENLEKLSNPNNNRKGILLSNQDTEKIGTNTITPVLWALYNELPPKTKQRPHKHNSVALDFCIQAEDLGNIYTLLGNDLDDNGNIVNPQKIEWKTSEMFITPPGLWHSHHNNGNTFAYILPIQDAGILLYQRILGIVIK